MGRNLQFFIGALVVLVGLVGAGVWWMGPRLAHLAFVDERRADAYVVLDLFRAARPQAYAATVAGLVAANGGERSPVYTLDHLVEGRREDEWGTLIGWQLAEASDLVQVVTATEYRALHAEDAVLATTKLGSYEPMNEQWPPVVLMLLVRQPESDLDALRGLRNQFAGTGPVIWSAEVQPVLDHSEWNRVLILGFNRYDAAMAWLRKPDVLAERALARSRAREFALAVYRRADGAWPPPEDAG